MSTTPNNNDYSKKKGKGHFFRRERGDSSSVNSLHFPASTVSNSADSARPLLNRTDGLHNFGVALDLLKNASEASEVLAPLKAVCGCLKVLVDIAESVQQNDDDLRDLCTRLSRQLEQLEQQHTTLAATKPKVGSKAVGKLVDALNAYIFNLNKVEELLNAVKNENDHLAKRLFKKVWTSYSTREGIKGCIRELDDLFQIYMHSLVDFIAHQTMMMRNDLANDAISRLPCADARGNQHDLCLEGTCVVILQEIHQWAIDSAAKPVLGLIDRAGTGKSTISAHMAQKWEREGVLTARFFFSLPMSVTNGAEFATTLARDLADNSPSLRSLILDAVNDHPNIKGYSIKEKLDWFILTPLKQLKEGYTKALDQVQKDIQARSFTKVPESAHTDIMETENMKKLEKTYTEALEQVRKCPTDTVSLSILEREYMSYAKELENSYSEAIHRPAIIIVDALDECIPPDRQVILEFVLNSLATESDTPPFKIFLTCRPEGGIMSKFHDTKYQHLVRQVDFGTTESNRSVHDDITLYATKYLSKILTAQQISLFIARAAGLFIWASTAKAFLDNAIDPSARFDNLLAHSTSGSPLDSLYSSVLFSAIESIGSDQVGLLKKVLQAICTAREPLSTSAIDEILTLRSGVVRRVVTKLGSVLSDDKTVQVLHPTFVEYFLSSRQPQCLLFAGDEADVILADGSLNILCSAQLKYDLCCIMRPLEFDPKNRDIKELSQRLEQNTTPGLRYAAVHGLTHVASSVENSTVLLKLKLFLENKVLYWIELMSLLGAVFHLMESVHHLKVRLQGITVKTMNPLMIEEEMWCQEIMDLVQPFQATIEEAAMQVYFSAFPFISSKSKIHHFYWQRFKDRTPIVLQGLPHSRTKVLAGHTDGIKCLSFSPDGRRLATGSQDTTVRLWDVATGAAVGEPLMDHTDRVECLSFSPDGQILATGSDDMTVRLWNVATGATVVSPLTSHTDRIECLSFSPDGKIIATGSDDRTVRMWDVTTGAVVGEPLMDHTDRIECLSFSPNSQIIATGSYDMTVRLWDVATGTPIVQPLVGHTDWIECLSFSPDGRILATGSRDGTARLWDVTTGATIDQPLIDRTKRIQSLTNRIQSLSFFPDGKILAVGSAYGLARLWDITTGTVVGELLLGHNSWAKCTSFSPDCKILATSSSVNDTVRLWDVVTGAAVGEPLMGHTNSIRCILFSPDGQTLSTGSQDKTARLWNVATGAVVDEPPTGHTDRIECLSFSPDGKILATGSIDNTACLWNVVTGAAIGQPLIGHKSSINCLSFSPDSSILATGSRDNTARLWNVATGAAVGEPLVGHTNSIRCISFSPDGQTLSTGSQDKTARPWNVATGAVVDEPLTGHTDRIECLSFSPDSKIFATGSDDRTVRLWDAATGAAIANPLSHNTYVRSLAFHIHKKGWLVLRINDLSTMWNISRDPPTKIFAQEFQQQISPPPAPFRFKGSQTLLYSSNCIRFSFPSGFQCTEFSSHKGLIVYGGEDGSVIIIDCRHLMSIPT